MVAVTLEPQRYFAEQIAGDKYKVNCILPAGQSPHSYEPTPQQLVEIGNCAAYFKVGRLGFEEVWSERFADSHKDLKIVDLSEGMPTDAKDPHTWLSIRGAHAMADNMLNTFCQLDPQNKDYYRTNYNKVKQNIDSLSVEIKTKLRNVQQRNFIIYHPVLSYYAEEFGFNQLFIEIEGKEPSPAQLKKLIDVAKAYEVKTVFIQEEFDKKNAALVAKEVNCKLETINPMAYDWTNTMLEIADYLAK